MVGRVFYEFGCVDLDTQMPFLENLVIDTTAEWEPVLIENLAKRFGVTAANCRLATDRYASYLTHLTLGNLAKVRLVRSVFLGEQNKDDGGDCCKQCGARTRFIRTALMWPTHGVL